MRLNSTKSARRRMRIPKIRIEGMESGQAIVLIAILMVVLIGFAALAIDGGGLFLLRRDAQNAADAAALAAAYSKCSDGNAAAIQTAALNSAESDGFPNSGRNVITVANNSPTAAGVTVTITSEKPSYFIQLISKDILKVTASSVGQCVNAFNPDDVKAIVGLAGCAPAANACAPQDTPVSRTGSTTEVEGGMISGCKCTSKAGNIEGGFGCYNDEGNDSCDDYHPGMTCSDPSTPVEVTDPPVDPFEQIWAFENFQPGGFLNTWASLDDQCTGLDSDFGSDPLFAAGAPASVVPVGSIQTGCYHYIAGNISLDTSGANAWDNWYFEGLYYVNGSVDVTGMQVGDAGATFVTETGQIRVGKDIDDGKYYDADADLPTTHATCIADWADNGKYDDPQCIDPVTAGTHWYPIFYSGLSSCDITASGAAISVNGESTAWQGISYAPDGGCNWSGANSIIDKGAFICRQMDMSGSGTVIRFDPDILPPVRPELFYGTGP